MNVAGSKVHLTSHNMPESEGSPSVCAITGPSEELEFRACGTLKFYSIYISAGCLSVCELSEFVCPSHGHGGNGI